MGRAERKEERPSQEPEAHAPRPRPQRIGPEHTAQTSPARALHEELAGALSEDGRRWSARRTLGFTVATCGSAWAVIIGGALYLFR